MWAFSALISAWDKSGPILRGNEHAAALDFGTRFLTSYENLAGWALSCNTPLFKLRPKTHYATHLIYDSMRLINPRVTSNFMDEDFIGKVVKTAALTHPRTMPLRCLERLLYEYNRQWNRIQRKRKRDDM
jgi:hypothetical protein